MDHFNLNYCNLKYKYGYGKLCHKVINQNKMYRKKYRKMEHVTHDDLDPVYKEDSKILILGSIPSKKSREAKFYYAHPQNRFWPILEILFQEKIENKKEFLLKHKIALWDVISSCDITGSSTQQLKM